MGRRAASRRSAVALAALLLAVAAIAAIASPAVAADAPVGAEPVASGDASSDVTVAGASVAADERCSGYGNATVLATVPGGPTYGPNDTVHAYSGSELVVLGCGDVRIDVDDRAWLEPLSASGSRARVRVTDAPPTGTTLGDLARPPIRGPAVAVLGAGVATDLVDGRLAVRSADERRQVDAAATAFREREAALETGLDALGEAAGALEDGAPPDDAALNETLVAHEAYRGAVADLRQRLYAVADSTAATGRHADALLALSDREAATASAADERVGEYDSALLERERSLTRALRLRVLGGGLAGLLVGCAIGAALPLYRGIAARRRLERGEWATYSRRTAAIPAAIGALVLLVGLGWIALEVGWQLLEVVT